MQNVCYRKLFKELELIAKKMVNHNPDLWEDAFGIMKIAVMENAEKPYSYLRKRAIGVVIDEVFRSSRYVHYWTQNRITRLYVDPSEVEDEDSVILASFEGDVISVIYWGDILDQLSEDEQIIIICCYWGFMADHEIGEILGIHRSTIGKQRRKILGKIRDIIRIYGAGEANGSQKKRVWIKSSLIKISYLWCLLMKSIRICGTRRRPIP